MELTVLPELKKFTVRRSKWLTPDKAKDLEIPSQLFHRDSGLMCCLGFALDACGIDPVKMAYVAWPGDLRYLDVMQTDLIRENNNSSDGMYAECNSELSDEASEINDDDEISNADREQKLIGLFSKKGIELTFVD